MSTLYGMEGGGGRQEAGHPAGASDLSAPPAHLRAGEDARPLGACGGREGAETLPGGAGGGGGASPLSSASQPSPWAPRARAARRSALRGARTCAAAAVRHRRRGNIQRGAVRSGRVEQATQHTARHGAGAAAWGSSLRG